MTQQAGAFAGGGVHRHRGRHRVHDVTHLGPLRKQRQVHHGELPRQGAVLIHGVDPVELVPVLSQVPQAGQGVGHPGFGCHGGKLGHHQGSSSSGRVGQQLRVRHRILQGHGHFAGMPGVDPEQDPQGCPGGHLFQCSSTPERA